MLRTERIIVGECASVMRQEFPDDCVDLIVTSPPYDDLRCYGGYDFDCDAIGRQMLRVLRPGGVAVWIVGERVKDGRTCSSFEQGLAFRDMGFRMHDLMVYQKLNTPFMRKNAYTQAHELMFVLSKGAPTTFNPLTCPTKQTGVRMTVYGRGADGDNSKRRPVKYAARKTRTNVWAYATGLSNTTRDKFCFGPDGHPAMFPEALARDHILSWSNPGDLVLDPMCGAGTTLKMASLHDRRWVGIEISHDYAGLAERRVKGAAAQSRMDLGGT